MFSWSFGIVGLGYVCYIFRDSGIGKWVFFILEVELGLLDGPLTLSDVILDFVEESVDSKAEVIGSGPAAVIGVEVGGRRIEVEDL